MKRENESLKYGELNAHVKTKVGKLPLVYLLLLVEFYLNANAGTLCALYIHK